MKPKTHKVCSKCKKKKLRGEFHKSTTKKDCLQSYCKECLAERVMYHYRNNQEYKKATKQRATELRRDRQKYVFEYFKTHKCVDCGERNPILLDMDHVRGEKILNVSTMAAKRQSIKTIQEEINKCDVRCVICHRLKTIKEQGWYTYLTEDESNAYQNEARNRLQKKSTASTK